MIWHQPSSYSVSIVLLLFPQYSIILFSCINNIIDTVLKLAIVWLYSWLWAGYLCLLALSSLMLVKSMWADKVYSSVFPLLKWEIALALSSDWSWLSIMDDVILMIVTLWKAQNVKRSRWTPDPESETLPTIPPHSFLSLLFALW